MSGQFRTLAMFVGHTFPKINDILLSTWTPDACDCEAGWKSEGLSAYLNI